MFNNLLKYKCIILLILIFPTCRLLPSYTSPYQHPSLAPISAQAHFYQGLVFENNGHWQKAAEHFDKAVCLDPQAPRIHLHLGRVLIRLQRYKQGIRYLKNVTLSAQTNDYMIWFELGEAYHWAGKHATAIRFYKRALKIFPKFQKARTALKNLENPLNIADQTGE